MSQTSADQTLTKGEQVKSGAAYNTDTETSELHSPTSEQDVTISSDQQLTITSQDLTVTSTSPLLRQKFARQQQTSSSRTNR
jgi:hypothetical protein